MGQNFFNVSLICFFICLRLYAEEQGYSTIFDEENVYVDDEALVPEDFDFQSVMRGAKEQLKYYPHDDFVYLKHRTEDKHILTFRTTNVLFSNELGNYCLRFVLRNENKNQSQAKLVQTGELLLDVDMKMPIVPYYMNLQKVKLSILGIDSKQSWSKNLSFNAREIEHTVKRCSRLEIRKDLFHKDILALDRIFSLNTQVFFCLEGSEGRFEFVLDRQEICFYKEFFKYAKMIKFF